MYYIQLTYWLGNIKFANSKHYIKYLKTECSSKETENIISLINLVHKFPGYQNQFIAVYAPSFAGKTQLAFALDKYTQFPLLPDEECTPPFLEKPLSVCLRIPCETALNKGNASGESQPINADIFCSSLHRAIKEDCICVDLGLKLERADDRSINLNYTMRSLYRVYFRHQRSYLLGFIVEWIVRRRNGEETSALMDSSIISFDVQPRSITQVKEELQLATSQPYVIVLDEYSLEQTDVFKKKGLRLLKNVLRACGFVVVTMGTNASTLIMTGKVALARSDSDVCPQLWSQVVTNIFSPPVAHLLGKIKTPTDPHVLMKIEPIFDWIKRTNCCLRPGILERFFHQLLRSTSAKTSADILDKTLDKLHSSLAERKPFYKSLDWILGQVRALTSGVCQDENVLRYLRCIGISKKVEGTLIDAHYAFLNSYSSHPHIPLFALYRSRDYKGLYTGSFDWKQNTSKKQSIVLEWVDVCDASYGPLKIDNYLDNFNTSAPGILEVEYCVIDFYEPTCGFPQFEQDEMGYLGLFHSQNPFVFKVKPRAFEAHDIKLFRDLIDKLSMENYGLTTRAAFTVAFRYICSNGDLDIQGDSRAFLEIVSQASLVIASYKFGISGSIFREFLPQFISELSLKRLQNVRLSKESIKLLGISTKCKMPFFPLIQATCSKELGSIPGTHTGTLKMVLNKRDEMTGIGFSDCLKDSVMMRGKSSPTGVIVTKDDYHGNIDFDAIKASILMMMMIKNQTKLLAQLSEPEHHFHFLISEEISIVASESNIRLLDSFENINIVVATSIDSKNNIELVKLSDLLKPAGIESEKRRKIATSGEAFDSRVPTTVIIIPYAYLFPNDGPIKFTPPDGPG